MFEVGDRVKVIHPDNIYYGEKGTVYYVNSNDLGVLFDEGGSQGFFKVYAHENLEKLGE